VIVVAMLLVAVFWHRSRTTAKAHSTTAQQQKRGNGSIGTLATTEDPAAQKRVAGTVFLESAPAAGATVRLVDGRSGTERAVRTDETGHFDFGAVLLGRYSVLAEVPHATGAALFVDLHNPTAAPPADQLRLVAHACEAVLHGVVRDASGGTIAKARIVEATRFMSGPGVDSEEDGSYELCVSVGNSTIAVRADGYADAVAQVAAFGNLRRDFDLVPEAVVAGRAVRADDGSAVPGARVTLVSARPRFDGVPFYTAISDNDGQFRFRGVGRGSYMLSANASHLATAEPQAVDADVSAPVEDLKCVLSAALSVAGHVVDKQKKPVVGATVTIQSIRSFDWASNDDGVVTQTDGSFVFDHLVAGDYRVRVRDYSLAKAARQLTLDKSDIADLVLEVEALGSIAGRVTRAGKPVEGADVNAKPVDQKPRDFENYASYAKSDADGRFALRGLQAGTYNVYAQSERVGAFTQGPRITLADAEVKTGVEVEMELAGSIAGVVVDQNDAPVAGVHLRFSLLNGEDGGQATTGEDGTFRATALSGGGDYVYEVRPAAAGIEIRPADGKRFPPIAVKDGNTQVTGVRIKVRYDRLSITGRVLTSSGEGAADVSVSAEQEPQRGWATPMATTDTSGRFTLRDLPEGTYTIRAQAANASQRVKGVAAGTKGVELELPGLGTIDGTLVGFGKPPTVMAFMTNDDDMMNAMPMRATIAGKKFTFANVPAGQYSIMARSDDGYATGEATVTIGAKAEVTLTNKGVGTVEGRVVDEKGAPVADIRCMGGGGRGTQSDSDGRFKLEHVSAGQTSVVCFDPSGRASGTTTVEAGGTAHVDIVLKAGAAAFTRSYAGLQFETRLSDIVVKQVETGSPGETAGVKVGDVLEKIGERAVDGRWGGENVQRMLEGRPAGTAVKLTIERDDKEQTVEVKLEAPR
jgi:hypothetical protein